MTTDFEHKELIEKLIDKTKKSQAIWQKTNRPNEFYLKIDSGRITIDWWETEHEPPVVDLAIYNPNGDKIQYMQFDAASEPTEFNILNNLYNTVSRKYYKVDETIANIKAELGSDKVLGKPINPPTSLPPQAEDDLPF